MSRTFKGRVVLSGAVKGEAAVSRQGFNTLATYYAGMADRSPLCHDQGNPDLYYNLVRYSPGINPFIRPRTARHLRVTFR